MKGTRWLGAARVAACLLSAASYASTATAQEPPTGPRYSFNAVVSEQIDNDRLSATLAVQVDGEDPAALAEQINRTMRAALDIVESIEALRVSTRNYRIVPERNDKGRPTKRWRGSQQLELQTGDVAAAMTAIERLQETLQMQDLQFSVAAETLAAASDRMIEQALQRFDARALLIARTAGAEAHRVIDAEISTSEQNAQPPRPRLSMRSADADSYDPAPAVAAGSSLVTVSVYGRIELIDP